MVPLILSSDFGNIVCFFLIFPVGARCREFRQNYATTGSHGENEKKTHEVPEIWRQNEWYHRAQRKILGRGRYSAENSSRPRQLRRRYLKVPPRKYVGPTKKFYSKA